ncbi:MAG: tetratricopeptide repeat protein, partial [Bacteroidaceae bacterium]|nr:tetratricopeptide repeat protein [Bacteroidaceae bacterium]
AAMLFARALDYYLVQDLDNALKDLNQAVETNDKQFAAYFNRALVRYKLLQVKKAQETDITADNALSSAFGVKNDNKVELTQVVEYNGIRQDFDKAIQLAPDFVYAYYNRGNLSMESKDYRAALMDYDKALSMDKELAEAYYNRGLCHLEMGKKSEGIADLSKAGELGLYSAYNILKRFSDSK